MANPAHLEIVRGGANSITEWRIKHPHERLNLHGAKLNGIDLTGANLEGADLSEAFLNNAILPGINMVGADLACSFFDRAILGGADLSQAHAPNTQFGFAELIRANLSNADLSNAHFFQATFTLAHLYKACLKYASVPYSYFALSNLSHADLSEADLLCTEFLQCDLTGTDLTGAFVHNTIFGDCDLSVCIGLELAQHAGPSTIGVDTLIRSFRGAGNRFTPEMEKFFLNAGVPKQLLDAIPRILAGFHYCTCFIAYGDPDRAFAEKLKKDLMSKDVSVWVYSLDATPGERTWKEIGQRRRDAEKMIVLCSSQALIRDGVLKEIEEQIDEDPDKIVPISLDDTWKQDGFVIRRGHREDLKTFLLDRNYADFCDESKYGESLNRLLKGIRREK
jgi:uncharacterized protein YjbI with pentapeptide repeats